MLAIFLQSTFLKYILPEHAVPDFCLLFVVFLAFNEGSAFGAVLAFLVGLLFDLSSGLIIGPWSASFSAGYALLSLLSRRVFLDSLPAAFLVVLMTAIFCNAIYVGLLFEFRPGGIDVISFLLESLSTAIFAPFVMRFLTFLLVRKFTVFAVGRGTTG